jgi:hypothetical protein
MSGFFQDLLQGAAGTLFGSDFLRDYTHASKTFRPNAYQNAPKLKFLFHVYFEVNPDAFSPQNSNYGLLVKTVKLPSFSIDVATMNQYNRKRLIQSKIKYDPIDITFHDDNGNTVRNLWKAYYNYYYSDGRKPQVVFGGARGSNDGGGFSTATDAVYNLRNQYKPSITDNADWGYIGESSDPTGAKIPFFKNITVFGFNQHNFAAYTLINPLITKFSHDTYDYAQGNGIMEQKMTLDYETVVYNEGKIDGKSPGNIVTGFGDPANYDRTLSPIARPGSQSNILGQGGLVDGVGGAIDSFANGQILAGVIKAGTTYNTFKNVNVLNVAKSEAVGAIINAVQQTPNRNTFANIPIFGSTPQNIGTAGSPITGQSSPQQVGPSPYAGKQTNGSSGTTGPQR